MGRWTSLQNSCIRRLCQVFFFHGTSTPFSPLLSLHLLVKGGVHDKWQSGDTSTPAQASPPPPPPHSSYALDNDCTKEMPWEMLMTNKVLMVMEDEIAELPVQFKKVVTKFKHTCDVHCRKVCCHQTRRRLVPKIPIDFLFDAGVWRDKRV